MREIFTDLYKKVLGFFQSQEKEEPTESKKVAVNRMKLVLMQDRTNLTPYLLERMRGEMIDVLAKYVEMDKEALELNFEQEGEQMALMLSIPVLRAKEEDEIKEILKAEDEAKAQAEAEEGHCEEQGDEAIQEDSEDEDEVEETEVAQEDETCTAEAEDEDVIDESSSPDETEEVEEETSDSPSKSKKRK